MGTLPAQLTKQLAVILFLILANMRKIPHRALKFYTIYVYIYIIVHMILMS